MSSSSSSSTSNIPVVPSLFHSGSPQESSSSKTFTTTDPSTGQPISTFTSASNTDIDAAIASAKAAFPGWSQTPAISRSRILQQAVALLRAANDSLALSETQDTGKPLSETSCVDIVTGADVLEYYANFIGGGGLNGETIQLRPGVWAYSTKEPLGVCAGIGAWNYPIQIALWKSAPCLAAGNTMVYKPSEFTPTHGLKLASIFRQAGLPEGVFNVVNGDGAVGAHLTAHQDIAKVSFTGQVSTGQKVAASAAGGMKYVTMELGGKSPLLVLPDADLDLAADGALMANFFSTGQVCTNGTRVYVPRTARTQFESHVVDKMEHVRAGDPLDPDTNFGPLVSEVHYNKVREYIRHGVKEDKAQLLYGEVDRKPGNIPEKCKDGYWIAPVVFTDCTHSMRIVQEEIFGPVMCIIYYDTLEEAIKLANDTPLGLAAGIFTKDINLAHSTIAQLQAGITWVNTWGESPAEMAVGGWKKSGLGVENGRKGIEAWMQNRSTLIDMTGSVATPFAPLAKI